MLANSTDARTHLKMIGSGVGGIELMIDGFSKKGNKRTDRTTGGQTLLQGCEDASKKGCNLKTKLKFKKYIDSEN